MARAPPSPGGNPRPSPRAPSSRLVISGRGLAPDPMPALQRPGACAEEQMELEGYLEDGQDDEGMLTFTRCGVTYYNAL